MREFLQKNKNLFFYIGTIIFLAAVAFFFGRCTNDGSAAYQQIESELNTAKITIGELERTAKETGKRIGELEQIEKRFTELQQRFAITNSELDRIYKELKATNTGITELYNGIEIGNREAFELVGELERRSNKK